MRKPRVSDFDPKAVHSLKSPLDDMPVIDASHDNLTKNSTIYIGDKDKEKDESPSEGSSVGTSARPPVRTPVRIKRILTRYSFEFFQDQVDSLKRLSLEAQMRGEKGNMSQMVREALDAYIAKLNRTEV